MRLPLRRDSPDRLLSAENKARAERVRRAKRDRRRRAHTQPIALGRKSARFQLLPTRASLSSTSVDHYQKLNRPKTPIKIAKPDRKKKT
ncbi:hypothetical protein Trydic_g15826 [Trypoxylus dichotomus]